MVNDLLLNTILPQLNALNIQPTSLLSEKFHAKVTVNAIGNMPGNDDSERTAAKLNEWIVGDAPTLELTLNEYKGLRIRLYRTRFKTQNQEFKPTVNNAIVFYSRSRQPHKKHSCYTKICNLSANKQLEKKIKQHFDAIKAQRKVYENGRDTHSKKDIPTLAEYLLDYQKLIYGTNPSSAQKKVNIIKRNFTHLLAHPINKIEKTDLQRWLTSHTVKRTQSELNSGLSHFDLAESTLKEALCTLRAAIRAASENSEHKFLFDEELLSPRLKLQINNTEEKYYKDEEIKEICTNLATRDRVKLSCQKSACRYYDYLTPLTLLCFLCGLRPKYVMELKKSDINFTDKTLTVRGRIGKIKKNEHIAITKEIEETLIEWLKHSIHESFSTTWLFPSKTKLGSHISCYKNGVSELRETLSFKHFDFRIIRHTFATNHTRQSKNIRQTQAALHHNSSQTTERYSHVIAKDTHDDMAAYTSNFAKIIS